MEYNSFGALRWPDDMRIAIVANGNPPGSFVKEIQKADLVIGVDRAAYWLIAHGITPAAAIGDFDSTSGGEFARIKKTVPIIKTFASNKDFTDTELALQYAIRKKPSEIILYGGSGTRLDHQLGTLHLLERCMRLGISAVFLDETNEVRVVSRGRTILNKRVGYRYVSVVPITNSIQITLEYFKYNIAKTTIRRGQTIGISNEFTGRQATITMHRGLAFIIQSRD